MIKRSALTPVTTASKLTRFTERERLADEPGHRRFLRYIDRFDRHHFESICGWSEGSGLVGEKSVLQAQNRCHFNLDIGNQGPNLASSPTIQGQAFMTFWQCLSVSLLKLGKSFPLIRKLTNWSTKPLALTFGRLVFQLSKPPKFNSATELVSRIVEK